MQIAKLAKSGAIGLILALLAAILFVTYSVEKTRIGGPKPMPKPKPY